MKSSHAPVHPAATEAPPPERPTLRAKRLPLHLPPTIGGHSAPAAPPADVLTAPLREGWVE